MAYSRSRRSTTYGEFWPGYVDVLSTLLLVVTFLMSVSYTHLTLPTIYSV